MRRKLIVKLIAASAIAALFFIIQAVRHSWETSAFEQAVTELAVGNDDKTVAKAIDQLREAGTKAFPVLISNVSDTSIASSTLQEATTGRTTVGDACFGILQMQVEDAWPKSLRKFHALNRNNVTKWWSTRKSKSLRELRLEAAQNSLSAAKKALNERDSEETRDSIRFIEKRLEIVRNES